MFAKKSALSLLGARRQDNLANSQFILKVREEERRDQILEDVFMTSTAENPYHKRIEASVALCAAVAKEKQRQHIENSKMMIRRRADEDFREMENKIRSAYVAKSAAAQRYEAQQLATEEKALRSHQHLELVKAHLYDIDTLVKRKQERQARLKRELEEQMSVTEAKRQRENQSKIEDKKLMAEINRKYKEEQLAELQSAHEKKLKLRKEMDDFEEIQKKIRCKEHDGVEEHQRHEKLLEQHRNERLKHFEYRKQEKIQKALKSEEIGKKIHELRLKKNAEQDHRIDLLIGERNEIENLKSARDKEKKKKEIIEFRNDLIILRQVKEQQKIVDKRREEELDREAKRILAEKDALQRIADEKKQNQVQSYRRALLDILNEKRRFKANEAKNLIKDEIRENETAERRSKAIKYMKMSYVNEHARALSGFMAPDLVRELV